MGRRPGPGTLNLAVGEIGKRMRSGTLGMGKERGVRSISPFPHERLSSFSSEGPSFLRMLAYSISHVSAPGPSHPSAGARLGCGLLTPTPVGHPTLHSRPGLHGPRLPGTVGSQDVGQDRPSRTYGLRTRVSCHAPSQPPAGLPCVRLSVIFIHSFPLLRPVIHTKIISHTSFAFLADNFPRPLY